MAGLSKQEEIRLRFRFESDILKLSKTGSKYLNPYIQGEWESMKRNFQAIQIGVNDADQSSPNPSSEVDTRGRQSSKPQAGAGATPDSDGMHAVGENIL
jgi:hypothetical protein